MMKLQQLTAPIARLLLAFIFVNAGYSKIFAYEGTQAYMDAMGVPGALLPLVILLELVGGILIIVGWQTRIVALLLAGFSIISALVFHYVPEDQMQMIMLMKNVSMAGGLLLLVSLGAGAYSLDAKLAK